jgi:GNAT superfamily N-acetyltransferase
MTQNVARRSPGTGPLRIRPARPADRDLLDALLRGLSPDSAYLRFQTGLGTGPTPAVLRALLPYGPSGGAVLAFVGDGVDGVPVAHGMWARPGSARAAEIAVVVTDAHQGRGIGTALARALMAELAARGIPRVEVFSGAGNAAVARMVARQAPEAVRVLDGPMATWTFAVPVAEDRDVVRRVA